MASISAKWTRIHEAEILQRSSQILSVVDNRAYVFGGELRPREPRDNDIHVLSVNEGKHSICQKSQNRRLIYYTQSPLPSPRSHRPPKARLREWDLHQLLSMERSISFPAAEELPWPQLTRKALSGNSTLPRHPGLSSPPPLPLVCIPRHAATTAWPPTATTRSTSTLDVPRKAGYRICGHSTCPAERGRNSLLRRSLLEVVRRLRSSMGCCIV